MQHAEAGARDQGTAIQVHAADAFGGPVRVAREQGVVIGRAQKAHDAQLLNELVDELLGPCLVESAALQVALDVDVEEGRDAADRHGGTVGLLDRTEIAEIGPLHRLAGVRGRVRDVEPVLLGHLRQIGQRPHLLGQFLPFADDVVGRPFGVEQGPLATLGRQQLVRAVQGHAAIVADDPAATIGIGQTGDDVAAPARHDLRRIGIEDAVIVGLAVLGEGLVHDRVGLETRCLQSSLDHAQPAIGHDGAAERRVGLQPDDHLVVAIDVAGFMGGH